METPGPQNSTSKTGFDRRDFRISRRDDHTAALFLRRTVAAQIHLVGFFAAVAGLVVLLTLTWRQADHLQFWACATFGTTSILVFGMSSAYHFLSDGLEISARLTQLFEDLDHFSIYLFIAGTYTPVILNTLEKSGQYAMIAAVWSVDVAGIVYTYFKARLPHWAQHRFFSTAIFVVMGWIALLRIGTIVSSLTRFGLATLVLGALSYTLGAVVYATKRPVLVHGFFGFHELWHVMVLLGFLFHFALVLSFYSAL